MPGGKRKEGLATNLETATLRMPELKAKHLENVNMLHKKNSFLEENRSMPAIVRSESILDIERMPGNGKNQKPAGS